MDFDSWLEQKGHTGFIPDAAAKQLHAAWIKETGGGFQPQIVEVPVPGGGSERAFMSSPNSATLMRDPQSRVRYEVGNDGNLYMIDGTTAAVVTNAVGGAPLQPNPKSSAFADMMGMMGQQPARQPEPGFIARLFGGGEQPAPTPAPAAAPMPTPVATGTPMPSPAPAATNAPAPVSPPSPVDLSTPEGIRAAWQSGRLSDQEAVRMLRGQP
jgi:hypothetical protein